MSTKNLARTVIEGGRYYRNCWERRQSHADERAALRVWMEQARADAEVAEARPAPRRKHVHRMFHDKLPPAERWLAAQVGRPWDDVYAELKERFDPRTTAGRHIVYDHMLGWVLGVGTHAHERYSRAPFTLDERGRLMASPGYTRRRKRPRDAGVTWRSQGWLEAFSAGRRVIPRGEVLFWGICTLADPAAPEAGRFRQGARLSAEEEALIRTLPAADRERLLYARQ